MGHPTGGGQEMCLVAESKFFLVVVCMFFIVPFMGFKGIFRASAWWGSPLGEGRKCVSSPRVGFPAEQEGGR